MSTDLEQRLSDGLAQLGAVEPPQGLADVAVHRVGRARRRRLAAGAAGAVVVVAAAIAVPLSLPDQAQHRQPLGHAVTASVPRTVVLSYRSQPYRGTAGDKAFVVLDPRTGTYVPSRLRYAAQPAPDGQHFVATDGRVVASLTEMLGRGGSPRQLHADAGLHGLHVLPQLSWSADSTRLLIPIANGAGQPVAFRIYDLTSNSLGAVEQLPAVPIGTRRTIAWGPDFDSVVVVDAQPDGTAHQLRFFDLDGKAGKTETLPVSTRPALTNDRWLFSPDGRYLALDGAAVLDLRTGRHIRPAAQHPTTTYSIVGWLSNDTYVLVSTPAKSSQLKNFQIMEMKLRISTVPFIGYELDIGSSRLPKTEGQYEGIVPYLGPATGHSHSAEIRL